MKKANGRYMQTECDRCGFTVHIDDTNRALLHGWGGGGKIQETFARSAMQSTRRW